MEIRIRQYLYASTWTFLIWKTWSSYTLYVNSFDATFKDKCVGILYKWKDEYLDENKDNTLLFGNQKIYFGLPYSATDLCQSGLENYLQMKPTDRPVAKSIDLANGSIYFNEIGCTFTHCDSFKRCWNNIFKDQQ